MCMSPISFLPHQANELELATDVYKSLLSEGCTPNLVTFNTLIEVYSKTGAWQDAVSVLDALEAQARLLSTHFCAVGQAAHFFIRCCQKSVSIFT